MESVEPVVARLKPDQDNSKHDSYITTDSDSENEKARQTHQMEKFNLSIYNGPNFFVNGDVIFNRDEVLSWLKTPFKNPYRQENTHVNQL